MRELILKDLLAMGRTLKIYVLFLSGYLALALMGLFELETAVAMIHIIIIVLPLGLAAHDAEKGETLPPAGSWAGVGARYLLVLMAAAVSGVLGLLGGVFLDVTGIGGWSEHWGLVLISLGTGLLIADFVIPIYWKLGQERVRPYLYTAVFLPMITVFGIFRLKISEESAFGWVVSMRQQRIVVLYLLLALVGLGVSFLISCRAAEQKTLKQKKNASF